jgi:protein involved in plasmid replication-relaxation
MKTKLTSRDIALFVDIYNYRYLSVSQIERLHFPSKITTWRRLQALTELGCIKAFTVPTIPERLFYLDKKGAEIVAIELQVDIEALAWHRHTKQPKDYYFLRHFMAINDFRILLTKSCEKNPHTLIGFIAEYIGEKTKEGHVKKYIRDRIHEYSHTPDGVFSLEKDGKAALFFLEIDRGIEIVSDPEKGFLKCIVFYLNYWTSQKWQRYQEDFGREFKAFRTLIVTTSKDRLTHMREAVTRLPFPQEYVKRFLWGTIQNEATEDWILEPIWRSMDIHDPTLYTIG